MVVKERVKRFSLKKLRSLQEGQPYILIRLAVLLTKYFIVPDVHSDIEPSGRQARQSSLLRC